MRLPVLMLTAVLSLIVATGLSQADDKPAAKAAAATKESEKPDPRSKLETAIPEAIRLLEANEHEQLIKNFVDPKQLEKMTARTPISEVAERFKGDKSDRLLKALKSVKDAKPELKENGAIAVYKLPEPIGSKGSIAFKKIDNLWYIEN